MGVPITEYILLVHCIIFTVLFVLLTVAISFGIGASLSMKNSRIELADGTTVWGNGDFDPDDTYGTVVYAKRSNRLLGVSD